MPNTMAPNFSDPTPNYFFFWYYVEDIVYGQRPHSLPELRQLIAAAFASITPVMPDNTAGACTPLLPLSSSEL
jgi:hypothetical protein